MKFLVILYLIKLIVRLNIFKHIEKKHVQSTLGIVRSLEKVKRKWFKIRQDINFIKICKKEDLIPTFAKEKLAIKSGNNRVKQKIAIVIMNAELQQKHYEKCQLKREMIILSAQLKSYVRTTFLMQLFTH